MCSYFIAVLITNPICIFHAASLKIRFTVGITSSQASYMTRRSKYLTAKSACNTFTRLKYNVWFVTAYQRWHVVDWRDSSKLLDLTDVNQQPTDSADMSNTGVEAYTSIAPQAKSTCSAPQFFLPYTTRRPIADSQEFWIISQVRNVLSPGNWILH